MIINTVQWMADNVGWFVNGNTWIMDNPLATGYDDVQRWIAAGNMPEPAAPVDPWLPILARIETELMSSDWTRLDDATLTVAQKDAWMTYRQNLRAIPTRYADPALVVFPPRPGERVTRGG